MHKTPFTGMIALIGTFLPCAVGQSHDGEADAPRGASAPARIVREPAAKIDLELLSKVKDATRTDQLVREPDAYVHLLSQSRTLVRGDLEALGMAKLDVDQILADPSKYRGHAFEAKGTLESIEFIETGEQVEVRGTLVEPAGARVAFTALIPPTAVVGDVVRMRGFFFKLLAVELKPGEYVGGVPCLVGKEITRSFFPAPPVTALDPEVLARAHESSLEEMMEIQEDVLFHVISWVKHLPAEERAKLQGEWLDVRELDKDPDRWRGKLITFNARCLFGPKHNWTEHIGPDGENPLEVDNFYEGIVAHAANRKMRWVSHEPFPESAVGEHDSTVVTAVFVKMLAWETTNGTMVAGPLIVPVRFDPFILGESSNIGRVGPWLAGAGAIVMAVLFWFVFRERKNDQSFRREIASRRAAAAAQGAGDTGGAGKSPPPPA